ncbi:aldehyde dehydrogenase family protein [Calidifontibacillus erzurumensis]|uniref:Aldehyde dehydrogenase family protein n=1 Tax=Calidifontibacillus erzurumensis TaxID=2741433 RepID=A0A8J8K9F4_9BACI|nr:aldehyde dehydrogenase family protein [Calidifontibacillus erzurumensis]NSL53091.1 aldehyde dehydrogenase family protein [Calidifontibacillus erzurumensis]
MLTTKVETYKNYINGSWVNASSQKTFTSINPSNKNDIVGIFQASTEVDVREAIEAAQNAFPEWSKTSPSKRASILLKAADIIESRLEQIASELTREEGKTIGASRGEVSRSVQTLRYYAFSGQNVTGSTFVNDDPSMKVTSEREPLGVVSVITPWNFPLSIPARKIAPALITGNTVVFKPSSDTPLIAYRLVEALHEAGIPKGVINFVTGSSKDVGNLLITHPAIRAVTFTGSTSAGEEIHRQVSFTTRTQMELGGKNPIVIMEDADIELAATLTVNGGFSLTGQACTGTSRVIVIKEVKERFINALVEKTKALKIGDGFEEGVTIGPLANERQLRNVLKYIEIGKKEGATLIYGGQQLTEGKYKDGYYVVPAIFTDVKNDMKIAQEEIFGPVIAVIEANDYEEAIKLANNVEYGLSASIVTNNIKYAHQFTKDIQAGTVKVNRTTTGNLVNAPFGGLKNSSTSTYRESGMEGLDFFTQTKTVYIGY